MEVFGKTVIHPLTIFPKSSITDVWKGSRYVFGHISSFSTGSYYINHDFSYHAWISLELTWNKEVKCQRRAFKNTYSQLTFTCSKSTIQTLEKVDDVIDEINDVVLVIFCYLWTYFTIFSTVYIYNFEQVNVSLAPVFYRVKL